MNRLSGLRTPASSKKAKTASKLDEHVERSGLDSVDRFIDPTTNVIYHKLKTLGKGGFAKVYQCRRGQPFLETDNDVALKIIPKSRVAKLSQREKIESEIQIQRNMDHPNIVKLFHSFEDSLKICLVVELCERKSLTSFLKSKGMIPQTDVARIGLQIVSALKYIHDRGIVHRDLKLGNILLTANGTAKLGDFGLAMYYRFAKPGNICGTPNFIPPEVLQDKVHGPKSDIWALGCVMCTLLSGKPAFEFTNMKDTYKRILKLQYNLPNTISKEATDLIRRILISDPDKRPNHREIMMHEMIQGVKGEFRSSRLRSSESALLPVTNLPVKRRMSDTDDVAHSSAARTVKKEYEHRLAGRRIDEDEVFTSHQAVNAATVKMETNHLFLDNRAQPTLFTAPLATPSTTRHGLNSPYSPMLDSNPRMIRRDYNQHVMNDRRVVWVTKWVDYSNKLGFGYMLSDGKIGANMTPPSRSYIVLNRNGKDVEDYSEHQNRKSTLDYTMPCPKETDRHFKILKYFKSYMQERLCSGASYFNTLSESAATETTSVRLQLFKSFDTTNEKDGKKGGNAMAMLLTNDTIQVNFVDVSTKLVVHQPFDMVRAVILLIDHTRAIQTFEMNDMHLFPAVEMDKLNSVHKVFHSIHSSVSCITDPHSGLHPPITNSFTVYGSVLCKLCSNSRCV